MEKKQFGTQDWGITKRKIYLEDFLGKGSITLRDSSNIITGIDLADSDFETKKMNLRTNSYSSILDE